MVMWRSAELGASVDGTVTYRSDPEDLFSEVDRGDFGTGVWLPPMEPAAFAEAVSTGDLLPPKSTRFLPKLASGLVWLGHDDNLPINLTGSSGALRIWADIMERQRFEAFKLSHDGSLEWRTIDPQSGGIVQQSCTNGVLLPFPQGRLPKTRSRCP